VRPADVATVGRRSGSSLLAGAISVSTVIAAVLGAPDPVLRVGVLVGVAATAWVVARQRGGASTGVSTGIEAGVLAIGGLLTGAVLVGLVLGATDLGFRTRAWALGLGAATLSVLLVSVLVSALVSLLAGSGGTHRVGARPAPAGGAPEAGSSRSPLRSVPWAVAVLVVAVLAVVGTAVALTDTARGTAASAESAAPAATPLAMAFGTVSGPDVDVVVTGSVPGSLSGGVAPADRFAVRVMLDGIEITYPVFTPASLPHSTRVTLPAQGRFVIDLLDADGAVVRSLTLAR
jgi:hypothetical protein